MSNREKIILFLTLGIALYGALDIFVLSKRHTGPNPDIWDGGQKALDFSGKSMANIARIEAWAQKEHWEDKIKQINSSWNPDPFIILNPDVTQDDTLQTTSKLIFTGYMQVSDHTFAVINGMEYTIDEIIEPQGFKVKEIHSTKVVLQNKSTLFSLYLEEK